MVGGALCLAACTETELLGRYPGRALEDAAAQPDEPRDAAPQDSDAAPRFAPDPASAHRGAVLLSEGFDDAEFTDRGWYDDSAGMLIDEGVAGSAFECSMSGQRCQRPGRIAFEEQENVYVSYWLRFSREYDLSHEVVQLFLLTNEDPEYIGPAISHLTVTVSQTQGRAQVGTIDSANVNTDCLRLNDDSVLGCDGDTEAAFNDYDFGEQRSVSACNGIQGDPTHQSCSNNDLGGYYSFRGFASTQPVFSDDPGQYDKTEWHFIEVLAELNSVAGGVGQADGRLRYWFDGDKHIDAQGLILRTGAHPDMRFVHLLVAPIELDSVLDERLAMDELTVAVGMP